MADNSSKWADMTLGLAVSLGAFADDPAVNDLLHELGDRVYSISAQQERFRRWCIKADGMYYAETFDKGGGADLWPDDPSAKVVGRAHVSVNTPSVYVDVPAALQAVEPIENMVASDDTPESRDQAVAMQRIYYAWKRADGYDLKFHKTCTVKALYGRTAAKVIWDKEAQRATVSVIEQPRNLYLGYKSDTYEEVEWAAYVNRMEPNAVTEEFGVDVTSRTLADSTIVPFVQIMAEQARPGRTWLNFGPARVEVWDYWYRRPVWRNGKYIRMDTWNGVFAGAQVVRGPTKYTEYAGVIPYVPLFNTFIPGTPEGRPELFDMEQLIREKYERITSGSQMIASGTAGDFWQLTGAEAPWKVPADLKPKRNAIIGPGPGNRIESITPFIAQFQLEQYLGRLDREMAIVSGLNDLLLGLAPAQVLSSSKAINALISNYESRLSMRRQLLYQWRNGVWDLVLKVMVAKSPIMKQVTAKGIVGLVVLDPSLSPRDEMETATRAANLVAAKLWSQRRAMNAVDVDDPEQEQNMIREESTDATLFPDRVQVMAQLMSALQALNLNANAATQGQAQSELANGQNDLRSALTGAAPDNTNAQQGQETQGQAPPIEGAMPEAGGPPPPFAQGPAASAQSGMPGRHGGPALMKQSIKGGKMGSQTQIVTQSSLGRR